MRVLQQVTRKASIEHSESRVQLSMDDFEEGADAPCEVQSFTEDANTMKNIGMDEVSPEGLTYHVNTMELEVER